MKAVDPTIKVGVVGDASEDSYPSSSESVTNPVTGKAHTGWTPIMLAKMKSLGVLPDFLIYHYYAQNEHSEDDAALLQYSLSWSSFATTLRSILTDYVGTQGAGIEILCTENNSVSTNPGKQSVSLVNALYMADSVGSIMQTEINSLVWWDLHNGPGTGATSDPANMSSSLYGWRLYGDYGFENGDSTSVQGTTINLTPHEPYPTYLHGEAPDPFCQGRGHGRQRHEFQHAPHPLRGEAPGRLAFAARHQQEPHGHHHGQHFAVSGFTPKANATVYSLRHPPG